MLLVSFFTTVAVTAGLLDDESDDDEDEASLPLEPDSAAAVNCSTGAGCSGSGWPSTVGSIHETSWPLS